MSPHLELLGSLLHALPLLATSTSHRSTAKPTSSSSFVVLLVYIVLFGGLYLIFIRPRSQRNKRARQAQSSIEVGDEVMLTSGIIGHVTAFEGDRARLVIAPGIEIQVLRAAIGRKVMPPLADEMIAPRPDDETPLGDNPYTEPAGSSSLPPLVAGGESTTGSDDSHEPGAASDDTEHGEGS